MLNRSALLGDQHQQTKPQERDEYPMWSMGLMQVHVCMIYQFSSRLLELELRKSHDEYEILCALAVAQRF